MMSFSQTSFFFFFFLRNLLFIHLPRVLGYICILYPLLFFFFCFLILKFSFIFFFFFLSFSLFFFIYFSPSIFIYLFFFHFWLLALLPYITKIKTKIILFFCRASNWDKKTILVRVTDLILKNSSFIYSKISSL